MLDRVIILAVAAEGGKKRRNLRQAVGYSDAGRLPGGRLERPNPPCKSGSTPFRGAGPVNQAQALRLPKLIAHPRERGRARTCLRLQFRWNYKSSSFPAGQFAGAC